MLGLNYGPLSDPRAADGARAGLISVYARGGDYHDVLKARLKALAPWLAERSGGAVKVFVDTAPVMEKPLAEAAGIGWQGQHTNLVTRDSVPALPRRDIHGAGSRRRTSRGGSLRLMPRCLDTCPTAAFPAPYQLDARRCLSYLTIEHKGPIPREFRRAMGNRIYGCDDCLAVCPWNKFARRAQSEYAFLPRAELTAPHLVDLADLYDAGFRTLFAGSPIKGTGRSRFVRNVLIALGNSGRAELQAAAVARLEDEDALVRGAAVWALSRLLTGLQLARAGGATRAARGSPRGGGGMDPSPRLARLGAGLLPPQAIYYGRSAGCDLIRLTRGNIVAMHRIRRPGANGGSES